MVLLVPVTDEPLGGGLRVQHMGTESFYSFLDTSCCTWHCAAFLKGCTAQLEQLDYGFRLALVFDLVLKNPPPLNLSGNVAAKLNAFHSLRQSLGPWSSSEDDTQPKMLALALEESVEKEDISFTDLRGADRELFLILQSMQFFDIHLAHVEKCQIGSPWTAGRLGAWKYRPNSVEGSKNEKIRVVKWINSDNMVVHFENLDIDLTKQVITSQDAFQDEPDVEQIGTGGQLFHNSFRTSLLVIWPKIMSTRLANEYGFSNVIDSLEEQSKRSGNKDKLSSELKEALETCKLNRAVIWRRNCQSTARIEDDKSLRLLRLCIDTADVRNGVVLMEILAFDAEDQVRCDRIGGIKLAEAIAEFVSIAGWSECSSPILRMISSPRAEFEIIYCTALVQSLMDRGCEEAAGCCANRIYGQLFRVHPTLWPSMKAEEMASIVGMFFRLEGDDGASRTSNPARFTPFYIYLRTLSAFNLSFLIVELQKTYATKIRDSNPCRSFYYSICLNLAHYDLNKVDESDCCRLPEVMKCLFWFGNEQLVDAFVGKICDPVFVENAALAVLTRSQLVWDECVRSSHGKHVLMSLIDRRVIQLELRQPPTMWWEQPNAIVPGYPEVQAFLRSSEKQMTYRVFQDVVHASIWATKYFGNRGLHNITYSARTGCGVLPAGGAFCVITKREDFYKILLDHCATVESELNHLNAKKQELIEQQEQDSRQ